MIRLASIPMPPPPAEKAAACQDQAARAVRTGDGSASSEASQRKLSFDPRIAGLAEILSAPDCVFPKWI
jgi:hypothetical protein